MARASSTRRVRSPLRIRTDSPLAAEGSWTPRPAFRRAAEVWRQEGGRSLWFKVAGELGYRRVGLHELKLTGDPEQRQSAVEASIDALGPEDLEDYLAFRPDTTAERFRWKVEHQRGVGVRVGSRLAAAAWGSKGRCRIGYVLVSVRLGPDDAMLEVYTRPDLRRRGLGMAACEALVAELQRQGISRSLAAIVPENVPSRRMFARLGYHPLGTIRSVGLGDRRRAIVPKRCGIELDRSAPAAADQ